MNYEMKEIDEVNDIFRIRIRLLTGQDLKGRKEARK